MHDDADIEKDNEIEPLGAELPDRDSEAAEDQSETARPEKSYYYDDAYGYEVYDPEKDDESDDEL